MLRLEGLDQRTLALSTQDGEVVHLVTRGGNTGMISGIECKGRSIDKMKCFADLFALRLKKLHTRSVIGIEAKIVDLVVAGLFRLAISVMFM